VDEAPTIDPTEAIVDLDGGQRIVIHKGPDVLATPREVVTIEHKLMEALLSIATGRGP
jgi:hypothetical protein